MTKNSASKRAHVGAYSVEQIRAVLDDAAAIIAEARQRYNAYLNLGKSDYPEEDWSEYEMEEGRVTGRIRDVMLDILMENGGKMKTEELFDRVSATRAGITMDSDAKKRKGNARRAWALMVKTVKGRPPILREERGITYLLNHGHTGK